MSLESGIVTTPSTPSVHSTFNVENNIQEIIFEKDPNYVPSGKPPSDAWKDMTTPEGIMGFANVMSKVSSVTPTEDRRDTVETQGQLQAIDLFSSMQNAKPLFETKDVNVEDTKEKKEKKD